MDPEGEELLAWIGMVVNSLPPEQAHAFTLEVCGAAMKELPVETLRQIRTDILAQLDPNLDIVKDTLDMIDGQIALREIGGEEQWR